MSPDEVLQEARDGGVRPVYLVTGEERWFIDRVVSALRGSVSKLGIAGFNEDKFTAGESSIQMVLSACKVMPMMAKKRLVLVRAIERWEKKEDEGDAVETGAGKKGRVLSPLDELAEYAKAPCESTVLVLVAGKLHAQRRLVTAARKGGYMVTCDALPRHSLPTWIQSLAKEKGHAIGPEAAKQLAELSGSEMSYLDDAIERLSLYVGPGAPITDEAIANLVTSVAQPSAWQIIDALGRRQRGRALALVGDVLEPHDAGLRVLGAVGWSVRQLAKLDAALADGLALVEAAQRAGVPPFKASELRDTLRLLPAGTLPRWLLALAEADLALKSSRRPAQAILEALILEMSR